MNKEIKFLLLILVVILVILGIMVNLVLKMTGEETECVRDPIKYASIKFNEKSDNEIFCSCTSIKIYPTLENQVGE